MSKINLTEDILSHAEKMHNQESALYDNLSYGEYKMKSKIPAKKQLKKDDDIEDIEHNSNGINKVKNERKEGLKDSSSGAYGMNVNRKDSVRKSIKKGY